MSSEAKKRAGQKYDAANTVQFHLKLNLKTDRAVIERLREASSMQGYIKRLVLNDIESDGTKSTNGTQNP